MKLHKIIPLITLTGAFSAVNAQIVYQENFDLFVEADEIEIGTGSSENIGNAYSEQWVVIADNKFNLVSDFSGAGNNAMAFVSNNNGAQRAAYYVIDGSSISAGSGTFSFDVLNSFARTSLRVGVWNVDNGSGSAGNANIYDTAAPSGTAFSVTTSLGVFGQGDATSTFLGTEIFLNGSAETAADTFNGTYDYSFTYDGTGDIVIGFGVESARSTTFGDRVVIDNISVAVPEPSTYAILFGMVALGCVLYRRRRR